MNSLETLSIWVGIVLCTLAIAPALGRLLRRDWDREPWANACLGVAVLLLGGVLVARGVRQGHLPAFGRFEAITFYAVAVLAVHLAVVARHRVQGMSALVAPFALLLLLCGVPGAAASPQLGDGVPLIWLGVHAGTAFSAYALCTFSGLLAVTYLIQDWNLKHKRFGLVFERLPSLESLDQVMSRQIGTAFFMLTLSGIAAMHLVRLSGAGASWFRDPKTVATLVTWGLYAVLMYMRTRSHRHGKGMALVTLLGVGLVLFSFFGVRVISASLHNSVMTGTGGVP